MTYDVSKDRGLYGLAVGVEVVGVVEVVAVAEVVEVVEGLELDASEEELESELESFPEDLSEVDFSADDFSAADFSDVAATLSEPLLA